MSAKKFQNKYRIESARLKNYDYASNGAYFVTIVTKNRDHFFGKIMNNKMVLNEIGKIAHKYWNEIPKHFPFVQLDEMLVMPNHIHGILRIDNPDNAVDGCDGDAVDGCDGDAVDDCDDDAVDDCDDDAVDDCDDDAVDDCDDDAVDGCDGDSVNGYDGDAVDDCDGDAVDDCDGDAVDCRDVACNVSTDKTDKPNKSEQSQNLWTLIKKQVFLSPKYNTCLL